MLDNLKKKDIFKFISILFVLSIISLVSFSQSVYASSGDSPDLAQDGFYPIDEQIADEYLIAAEATREINALTDTEYTIDDIYNLLYSSLRGSSSSTTYSLPYIANRLNLIRNDTTSIDTKISTTNSRLLSIVNNTTSIDSNTGNMVTKLNQIDSSLDNIETDTDSISTNVSLIASYNLDTRNNTTTIANNVAKITSGDWKNISGGLSYFDSNFNSITYSNWTNQTLPFYIQPNFNIDSNNNRIYRFVIPVAATPWTDVSNINISFILKNQYGVHEMNVPYMIDYYNAYTTIYFILQETASQSQFYIKFNINAPIENTATIRTTSSAYLQTQYLNYTDIGYWDIYNTIFNKTGQTSLEKLANIYASDDLIAAKEEQQDYEDSVIEDFTGNGDGASSRSDSGSAKNISKTVRNNLNMGGSANDALSVFTQSSSLWEFFTSTTSSNLNTVGNSRDSNDVNNSNRSNYNPVNMEIIDFLTSRDRDYYNMLGSEYNENDYR